MSKVKSVTHNRIFNSDVTCFWLLFSIQTEFKKKRKINRKATFTASCTGFVLILGNMTQTSFLNLVVVCNIQGETDEYYGFSLTETTDGQSTVQQPEQMFSDLRLVGSAVSLLLTFSFLDQLPYIKELLKSEVNSSQRQHVWCYSAQWREDVCSCLLSASRRDLHYQSLYSNSNFKFCWWLLFVSDQSDNVCSFSSFQKESVILRWGQFTLYKQLRENKTTLIWRTTEPYLKGKLSADVVLWSNSCYGITGQRNTAENRFLSAIWGGGGNRKRVTHRNTERERHKWDLYIYE